MLKIDPRVLGPKSRLGGWAHYVHLRNLKSLLTSPWWSQEQRSWMATRRSLQQIYHHNTDDSNDGERTSSKPSQTNEKETLPLQHVSDNVPPRKTNMTMKLHHLKTKFLFKGRFSNVMLPLIWFNLYQCIEYFRCSGPTSLSFHMINIQYRGPSHYPRCKNGRMVFFTPSIIIIKGQGRV